MRKLKRPINKSPISQHPQKSVSHPRELWYFRLKKAFSLDPILKASNDIYFLVGERKKFVRNYLTIVDFSSHRRLSSETFSSPPETNLLLEKANFFCAQTKSQYFCGKKEINANLSRKMWLDWNGSQKALKLMTESLYLLFLQVSINISKVKSFSFFDPFFFCSVEDFGADCVESKVSREVSLEVIQKITKKMRKQRKL